MFGFLNIDKPKDMTSHDVVACLRKAIGIKQIGHTGTLDPMATGVLPVAIGKATRLIEFLHENKGYIAEIKLGKVSDTYDSEGAIKDYSDKIVSHVEFEDALVNYRGKIEQTPPAHSAVHYNGKRLYELARNGVVPQDIPARTVFITKLEVLEFDFENQTATIDVECSKGTYIRSLINDLGLTLGCGALMSGLKRTKSGLFTLDKAFLLESFQDSSDAEKYLINPVDVLPYKSYNLSEFEFQKIKHGQSLETDNYENNEYVCLLYEAELCAIAQKKEESNILSTKKVFIS